jgi:hypothetical protein
LIRPFLEEIVPDHLRLSIATLRRTPQNYMFRLNKYSERFTASEESLKLGFENRPIRTVGWLTKDWAVAGLRRFRQ